MRSNEIRNRWIGVNPEAALVGASIQGCRILKVSNSEKQVTIPKKCRAIRGRTMLPGKYVFVLAQIPVGRIA